MPHRASAAGASILHSLPGPVGCRNAGLPPPVLRADQAGGGRANRAEPRRRRAGAASSRQRLALRLGLRARALAGRVGTVGRRCSRRRGGYGGRGGAGERGGVASAGQRRQPGAGAAAGAQGLGHLGAPRLGRGARAGARGDRHARPAHAVRGARRRRARRASDIAGGTRLHTTTHGAHTLRRGRLVGRAHSAAPDGDSTRRGCGGGRVRTPVWRVVHQCYGCRPVCVR
mmetsp:Transcript_31379/g.101416  ORF Transcript_31379/g.101416 Transcript_31379/m.101416 type:complete len:229 (-) Transcript_31379:138-824(-)